MKIEKILTPKIQEEKREVEAHTYGVVKCPYPIIPFPSTLSPLNLILITQLLYYPQMAK